MNFDDSAPLEPCTHASSLGDLVDQPIESRDDDGLVPKTPAVPSTAAEQQQHDDNDQKRRRVHNYLPCGLTFDCYLGEILDGAKQR